MRQLRLAAALVLLASLEIGTASGAAPGAVAGTAHHVTDGFVLERAAVGAESVRFPMFGAFDERGRLFVAESSGLDLYAELKAQTRRCRIRLLEDRDGDGRFERSTVFAEGLVFPMGLVWRAGKLYVADPPDLVALEDTDGDGRADKHTVVLTGFGHTDNGSLHGLTFGPDGRLYMTMGNPDGYRLKRDDGSVLEGESGALIRARADGSGVEVLARGFENLVEIVFLPTGEIVGTDNWFTRPTGGVRDALIHLVEGGRYPLHPTDKRTRYLVSGDPLPAITMFPAVAHSGMTLYRGEVFPAEHRGALFSAQHNTRKVVRHRLSRQGASFTSEDTDFLWSDDPDFHPSDVIEDADGSLLVVDTGSWYIHHCPTGRIRKSPAAGGIWRMRWKAGERPADPWGAEVDDRKPPAALAAMLGDARPAARDRAEAALVRAGRLAVPALAAALRGGDRRARPHAAWALVALAGSPEAREELRRALDDRQADTAALAARALAAIADREAAPKLRRLLGHAEAHVRMAAAEALAHCGSRQDVPALVSALVATGKPAAPAKAALVPNRKTVGFRSLRSRPTGSAAPAANAGPGEVRPDPFFTHALTNALHKHAARADLERLLVHRHAGARATALRLLDQPPHDCLKPEPALAALRSTDEGLRKAAVAALRNHPDWASRGEGALAELLAAPKLGAAEEEAVRELVLAWEGAASIETLVAEALHAGASKHAPPGTRRLLVQLFAKSGRARLPELWIEAVGAALSDPAPDVRAEAVRTTGSLRIERFDDRIAALIGDAQAPAALRVAALRALAVRRPARTAAEMELLIGRLAPERPALERLAAAEVIGLSSLAPEQIVAVARRLRRDPVVPPAVLLGAASSERKSWPPLSLRADAAKRARLTDAAAAALLEYLSDGPELGWTLAPAHLTWLRSSLPPAQRARAEGILRPLGETAERQTAELAAYEPFLKGGDSHRGEEIFFGKAACAACHQVGARGGSVGPDLTKIGAIRAGRDILESIVIPSATFAQGFDSYAVVTKDGQTLAGIRVDQSDEVISLRDASGTITRVPRAQIERVERSSLSLMPEGLLAALSKDEARDLLGYLQSLR